MRKEIINYRRQRARETLEEAKIMLEREKNEKKGKRDTPSYNFSSLSF